MRYLFPSKTITGALALALLGSAAWGESVKLASGGQAHLNISVSDASAEELKSSVERLKGKLSAITGASFESAAPGKGGQIILGLRSEYPHLLSEVEKDETSTWKERYRLLSEGGNLYIIGETNLAVAHGVADLLHRIGYRYLLPPKAWEVTPSIPDLSVDVDVTEQPRYATRLLFMGSGGDKNVARASRYSIVESNFGAWRRHMRAFSAFRIRTGHAWIQMAQRNEAAFLENPQWIVEGSPDFRDPKTQHNFKFNLQHDDLLQLLQKDSLEWLRNNPSSDTVSVDPSDGANWPVDSPLGTPSDQVVYLANAVSDAVRAEMPDKKVAFYAYHMHSPPPTRELNKGIIVNVATGFIRGGFTVEELMKGWRAKGAELGIRDYTNVFFGSWGLPGSNYHGFSPKQTQERLRKYYQDGARYWISETDNAWAAIGLGAYVGFHTLWNPVDGPSSDELVNDFIEKAFGKGAEAMQRYFAIVDPESHPIVSEDLAARMYGALSDALKAPLKPEERTRVLHLVTYVRFVELMHAFRNAEEGQQEEEAFRALAEWAYHCRDFQMFSSRGTLSHPIRRKPALEVIRDEVIRGDLHVPSEEELFALLQDRLSKTKRIGFQPVVYSEELLPAAELVEGKAGEIRNFAFSQSKRVLWQAKKDGDVLALQIRALGKRPTPPRPTEVSLKLVDDVLNDTALDLEVPAETEEWQSVELKAPLQGLYEVKFLTHGGHIELQWEEGTPVVMPSGQVGASFLHDVWDACFYVPPGVDRIGGYSERARGALYSEAGERLYDFSRDKGPGYFDIAIAPSKKGRVFRFREAVGSKLLMTVPPYLARRGSELLIPKDTGPSTPTKNKQKAK